MTEFQKSLDNYVSIETNYYSKLLPQIKNSDAYKIAYGTIKATAVIKRRLANLKDNFKVFKSFVHLGICNIKFHKTEVYIQCTTSGGAKKGSGLFVKIGDIVDNNFKPIL